MDPFHLLTRGGQFNKSKFKKDVEKFSASRSLNHFVIIVNQSFQPCKFPNAPSTPSTASRSGLPPELDFFKYTKRKLKEREGRTLSSSQVSDHPLKRRKLNDEDITPPGKQR